MNPFWPVYTPYQLQRLADGRKQLLATWARPPYSSVAPNFHVTFNEHSQSIDEHNEPYDEFTAYNAPPTLPDAWKRLAHERGFTLEARTRGFTVCVPHEYYLRRGWLPVSVSRACAINVLEYVVVICVLARMAYALS